MILRILGHGHVAHVIHVKVQKIRMNDIHEYIKHSSITDSVNNYEFSC